MNGGGGKAAQAARRWRRWSRQRIVWLLLLCALCGGTLVVFIYFQGLKLAYLLRPVWDTPAPPFNVYPHYYAANISVARRCELHNWKVRFEPRRVFDAILFSNELDLLDIRLHELQPHVHRFVIVESDRTFTGRKKPLFFAENRQRFEFVQDRVAYGRARGRELLPGEDPFLLERFQRRETSRIIVEAGIGYNDLLIMSDVDEIPSAHSIELLRWCDGWQAPLHLQMKNYIHSFEFPVDYSSWRASVHIFDPETTGYTHKRRSDFMLADSGWHCSFCFRHLSDIQFKMLAYSHADRVRHQFFLDPARIQAIICEGRDLFDMLPEEYTFREIISKMGPVPKSSSAVNLPAYLIEHIEDFRFLLPGGCVREPQAATRHLLGQLSIQSTQQRWT
ncbi:beta-1,4-mannosyl-glycoprotein beta-1,4-N-acetylglucosaminyltransferase [Marchantia polymorpha subsp. ruderalis]|nr:hypothetical protein MARPO_0226s0009 [Marchantia polymorpha]BBN13798.1 hypothetical protein Mp_6g06460 [Marchantia polymorpha subsp. ruderalis]|eukprot:PTQ27080.1 hypothetical protein MARPO_0226s0009 [Marchantia polymorpha]